MYGPSGPFPEMIAMIVRTDRLREFCFAGIWFFSLSHFSFFQ